MTGLGRRQLVGLKGFRAFWRVRLLRFLIRMGKPREVLGVKLVDISQESASEASIEKLAQALALVATTDEPTLGRIRRELDQIVIYDGVDTRYDPGLNACFLDGTYLIRRPVAQIAMTLVHEATHAELFRQGHGYEPEERASIEARCVAAEIAFAERVPGTEDLVAHSRRQLANPWWTDVALFDRRIALYRAGGWPEWLVSWYERRYRPPAEKRSTPNE